MARLPSLLTLVALRLRSVPRRLARWPRAAIVVALCALVVSTVGAGLLVVHITHAGSPTTVYVNDGPSGSDSNDCASAASPCLTIQHALSLVASGGTVEIAANIYPGGFSIGQSVKLVGAGPEETTISGGAPVITVSSGCFVTLSGLTVTAGNNTGSGDGAGINNSGTLTISDSVVSDNTDSGGGNGGGIANGGTLTISDSVVSDNTNSGGGAGGGISNTGTLTISDSVVSGNSASAGGGIYSSGTLTISDSSLSGNTASSGSGGGILNDGGTLTVTTSSLSGNIANLGSGGGIDNVGGTAHISGSTLVNNQAVAGGGIYVYAGTTSVANSTLYNNDASNGGGGLALQSGTLTVDNATISGNSTGGVGGGISSGLLPVYLGNTVLAGNSNGPAYPGTADCSSVLVDDSSSGSGVGNNFIGTDNSCGSIVNGTNGDQVGVYPNTIYPGLEPLAANGGPTLTMQPQGGSPLIGKGAASICGSASVQGLDQRGYPRLSTGAVCDIGAYDTEYSASKATSTGSTTTQHVYVNNGPTGNDSSDCLSAAAPCLTIVGALGKVASDGTITIAAGLYAGGFAISKNVTLTGAGADVGGVNYGVGGAQHTSISGGGPVITVSSGTVTLTNLTITGGDNASGGDGGGIANGGTLTVSDSVVSDNTNSGGGAGGGIANGGTLTVSDSVVSGNSALVGGGIYSSGTLTISDSSISGNTASSGSGGGILAGGGSLTITTSSISGNIANLGYGGGIDNVGGTAHISGSTLVNNQAVTGGGIDVYSGTTSVANSTLYNNDASNGGGGLALQSGTLTVDNATINRNSTGGVGGGIDNTGGALTITNATIDGNYASSGAGGIVGTASLDNTDVYDCSGTLSDATSGHGNNFIGIGGCGLTNGTNGDQVGTGVRVGLAVLAANGGPTLTEQPQSGSPLIGAAYGPTCSASPVNGVDQRGYPRRVSLYNNCTIGAYDTSAAAASTMSFGVSPTSSVFGQSVTLSVTVAASAGSGPTPTGSVTFYDGSTSLGTQPLDGSGKASLSTSSLAVGSHSLSATYGGDTNYNGRTITPIKQTVNPSSTTTTLVVSPTTSVSGQMVTLTATVAAVAPGTGTPPGSVSFMDGTTPMGGPVTLTGGQATLTTSSLAIGTHALSAGYNGTADYAESTGTASALVSAATPPPTGASNGYVRFVQATGYPSVDISIDGTVDFPNVAQYAVQPYSPIAAGSHAVVVLEPSGGTIKLVSGTINVVAGQYQTVLLSGSGGAGSGKLVAIVDNPTVSAGQAQVRVYNAQANTGLSYTTSTGSTAAVGAPGHGAMLASSGSRNLLALAHVTGFGSASQQQQRLHLVPGTGTTVNALAAGSAFTVAPQTLTVTITPNGEASLTDTLALSANQIYSVFVFDGGTTTNAAAPSVPLGLPQTGVGPAHSPFLPWLLGLLVALIGAGAASWYLLLYRPGRSLEALVGWLGEGQRQRLSAVGEWLRRRFGRRS